MGSATNTSGFPRQTPDELTIVEYAVLVDMARGLTNEQIAHAQFRSVNTIKTHGKNIFRVLGAKGRAEAVTIAYQRGLLPPPWAR